MSHDEEEKGFEAMKSFIGFGAEDAENLKALKPVAEKHGPAITARFYEVLDRVPQARKIIAGRIDQLKVTHQRWMMELFAGDYGDTYYENRMRIGQVHVVVGVRPEYVESVVSLLRRLFYDALRKEISDAEVLAVRYKSLVKILDIDLQIINLAYADHRLERMSTVTGMSRKLIENLILFGGK